MPSVHNNVVLQALSTFTDANVKPLTEESTTGNELNVFNFLSTTFGKQGGDEVDAPIDDLRVELKDFLDRKFDYDFTNLKDNSACKRGDETYTRPRGWYRVAVKVLNKYDDGDNTWLGPNGWRSHSVPGEWPVSYFGTNMDAAKETIENHYRLDPGKKNSGGIYSTSDIKKAEEHSERITDQETGKTYKIILQNRINPQKRIECGKNGWLISIPDRSPPARVKRIVEESVRPYGILFKEV